MGETSQSKIDQTETGQSQTISTTKPEAQKPKQKPKKVIEKDTKEAEFLGFKLKKAETVKRQVEQDEMESINLKHHEFEMQWKNRFLSFLENFYIFFSNFLIENLNFSNIFSS